MEKTANKSNRKLKIVCAATALILALSGAALAGCNDQTGKFEKFRSEEFKQALRDTQHSKVNLKNPESIENYLESYRQILIDQMKSLSTIDFSKLIDKDDPTVEQKINCITMRKNVLHINFMADKNSPIPEAYFNFDVSSDFILTKAQLADLNLLLDSRDPEVRIKILPFLCAIVKNSDAKNVHTVRTHRGIFYDFANQLKELGYAINYKNFYTKFVYHKDDNPVDDMQRLIGEAIYGYCDNNIATEFKTEVTYNVRPDGVYGFVYPSKVFNVAVDDPVVLQDIISQFGNNIKNFGTLYAYINEPNMYINNDIIRTNLLRKAAQMLDADTEPGYLTKALKYLKQNPTSQIEQSGKTLLAADYKNNKISGFTILP